MYHHSGDSDSDADRAAQQQTTVHEFRGFLFLLLHITYCAASGQKVYTHIFVVYVSQISQSRHMWIWTAPLKSSDMLALYK